MCWKSKNLSVNPGDLKSVNWQDNLFTAYFADPADRAELGRLCEIIVFSIYYIETLGILFMKSILKKVS
jgi:hypothetical protein